MPTAKLLVVKPGIEIIHQEPKIRVAIAGNIEGIVLQLVALVHKVVLQACNIVNVAHRHAKGVVIVYLQAFGSSGNGIAVAKHNPGIAQMIG